MPSGRHIDGTLNAGLHGDPVAGDALLVYERVLPALPASITRTRTELADTLASHDLAPGRRDDILLVGELGDDPRADTEPGAV